LRRVSHQPIEFGQNVLAQLRLAVVLAPVQQTPLAKLPKPLGHPVYRAAGDVQRSRGLRRRAFEQIDNDQVARLESGVATFPHVAEQLLLVGEPQFGNNPVHGNSSSGLVARLEYNALEFPFLYPQHVDLQ
jgi:hypothetical protein